MYVKIWTVDELILSNVIRVIRTEEYLLKFQEI